MPRGYRCIVFVVVGWLALCGAQKTAPGAQSTTAPVPTLAASASANFSAYPGYDPDPCYHAKDHEAADLCAQWRASIAAEKAAHEARRSTNWSIVATLLSAVSLIAVAIALALTVQSNRIARTTARAQLRPYVHAKEVDWQPRADGGEQYIDFKVRFINSGQTPAKDLQLAVFGYLSDKGGEPIDIKIVIAPESQKLPLGPANEILTPAHTVGADTLNAIWRGDKRLFIAGVVRYRDNFSHQVWETRCHYEIRLGKQDDQFNWAWWDTIGQHNDAT